VVKIRIRDINVKRFAIIFVMHEYMPRNPVGYDLAEMLYKYGQSLHKRCTK